MIVSYERFKGGLLLREVATEEEAFAEMRRFLEVNNIPSDYTTVKPKLVYKDNEFLTSYKYVGMGSTLDGYTVAFGIYFEGQPDNLELGSEERWHIEREDYPSRMNFSYRYKPSENRFVCWYDEVAEYFRDLAERKAGGG